MQTNLSNGQLSLDLSRPLVMGILNATPDSFSDGGKYATFEKAFSAALQMVDDGADIIDVGGESTRPGAATVSEQEELSRTVPLVQALSDRGVIVSIDSSKAKVMEQCLLAGAFMLNDVRALQEPGALQIAAQFDAPVCLMHMQGQPRSMQRNPDYSNVVENVKDFFQQRVNDCLTSGIKRERIILDPGFGFGKKLQHNLCLLGQLHDFYSLDCLLLAGVSRKSMFGDLLGLAAGQRETASVVAATLAIERGAHIVRVHDVKLTRQAVDLYHAVRVASGRWQGSSGTE